MIPSPPLESINLHLLSCQVGQASGFRALQCSPRAYRGETEAFIRAVETGGRFRPDLQEALVSMLACEAVAAGGETDIVV